MRKLLAIAALLPTLGAALGCGGSDRPTRPPGPNEIVMTEYAFAPRNAQVRRGVAVNVRNDGQIAHNLSVERAGSSDKLLGTDSFLGGRSQKLRIDLAPGRYRMVCTVPGHEQLGMTGSLTVK